MRHFSLTALVFGGVVLAAACQATGGRTQIARDSAQQTPAATVAAATPAQEPSDGARRITVEELRQAIEKKEAVVVDVRGEGSYKAGRIKGARWIPVGEVKQRSGELPRDKTIVTYCS